jgi:hypothetical protein
MPKSNIRQPVVFIFYMILLILESSSYADDCEKRDDGLFICSFGDGKPETKFGTKQECEKYCLLNAGQAAVQGVDNLNAEVNQSGPKRCLVNISDQLGTGQISNTRLIELEKNRKYYLDRKHDFEVNFFSKEREKLIDSAKSEDWTQADLVKARQKYGTEKKEALKYEQKYLEGLSKNDDRLKDVKKESKKNKQLAKEDVASFLMIYIDNVIDNKELEKVHFLNDDNKLDKNQKKLMLDHINHNNFLSQQLIDINKQLIKIDKQIKFIGDEVDERERALKRLVSEKKEEEIQSKEKVEIKDKKDLLFRRKSSANITNKAVSQEKIGPQEKVEIKEKRDLLFRRKSSANITNKAVSQEKISPQEKVEIKEKKDLLFRRKSSANITNKVVTPEEKVATPEKIKVIEDEISVFRNSIKALKEQQEKEQNALNYAKRKQSEGLEFYNDFMQEHGLLK